MNAAAAPGAREVPAWVAKYIGLPFKDHARGPTSFDCWGLVRWVLLNEFCMPELPDHGGYAHADHGPEVAAIFDEGLAEAWRRVERRAQPGDIVVINKPQRFEGRLVKRPAHVGLIVAQDVMLHIERVSLSVIERYDRDPWKHSIEGIYRHVAMIGGVHGQAH